MNNIQRITFTAHMCPTFSLNPTKSFFESNSFSHSRREETNNSAIPSSYEPAMFIPSNKCHTCKRVIHVRSSINIYFYPPKIRGFPNSWPSNSRTLFSLLLNILPVT
ncbi:hypothetical protein MANES_11G065125v8 [Manihot esculenta]|uniref:Uncharacterized protein n=1 Tax=Manihot esculenta TaxID=3983 RepID=A0ACB7GV25_MANES|nr:hypothetical protein MANES_11G065125v8 [Manihot esculenta]